MVSSAKKIESAQPTAVEELAPVVATASGVPLTGVETGEVVEPIAFGLEGVKVDSIESGGKVGRAVSSVGLANVVGGSA